MATTPLQAEEEYGDPTVGVLTVTSPDDLTNQSFPITVSGVASPRATVTVRNADTNTVLGTGVADSVTGAWNIEISHT